MADQSHRLSILKSELNKSIEWFHREADKHKKVHRFYRYSVFGLTALGTICASIAIILTEERKPIANVCVVAVTALSGLFAALEGLRKPADLWQNERGIEYALMDIQR